MAVQPVILDYTVPGREGDKARLPGIGSEEELHGFVAHGLQAGRAVQPLHPRFSDVIHVLNVA